MNFVLLVSFILPIHEAATPNPRGVLAHSPLVQCESPLGWRVGSVDPSFGLTQEEASDAVRRAAMLWGEALGGRLLFREDPLLESGTIEIVFEAGDLSNRARASRARRVALTAESDRLEITRQALDSVRAEIEGYRARQLEANQGYLDRMAEYNRLVATLNEAGGVSPQMDARLSEMAGALQEEQTQLNTLTAEFNSLVAALNARTEQRNLEVAAYNRDRDAFEAEVAAAEFVQSAYQESRRELGPLTAFVSRTIEVYDFENRNDLILILAREMGRALGLPVNDIPGTVMSGTASREGVPALHPSDIAAVRALCEGL